MKQSKTTEIYKIVSVFFNILPLINMCVLNTENITMLLIFSHVINECIILMLKY